MAESESIVAPGKSSKEIATDALLEALPERLEAIHTVLEALRKFKGTGFRTKATWDAIHNIEHLLKAFHFDPPETENTSLDGQMRHYEDRSSQILQFYGHKVRIEVRNEMSHQKAIETGGTPIGLFSGLYDSEESPHDALYVFLDIMQEKCNVSDQRLDQYRKWVAPVRAYRPQDRAVRQVWAYKLAELLLKMHDVPKHIHAFIDIVGFQLEKVRSDLAKHRYNWGIKQDESL
jgi:hypothetical protein